MWQTRRGEQRQADLCSLISSYRDPLLVCLMRPISQLWKLFLTRLSLMGQELVSQSLSTSQPADALPPAPNLAPAAAGRETCRRVPGAWGEGRGQDKEAHQDGKVYVCFDCPQRTLVIEDVVHSVMVLGSAQRLKRWGQLRGSCVNGSGGTPISLFAADSRCTHVPDTCSCHCNSSQR